MFLILLCSSFQLFGGDTLSLIENLKKADAGDFIVTAQNKSYSLLNVLEKNSQSMTIEEISVPANKIPRSNFSWRQWVAKNAPGNTCWMIYKIDLRTAAMTERYALTKRGWQPIQQQDNFLYTLLNLRLEAIPTSQRRRIGITLMSKAFDNRPFWQPTLVVEGRQIQGIPFDAWRTVWPKDGSELAGKMIEVYVPAEGTGYPCYFPYWLQINGTVGNSKIRIVDSGTQLESPASPSKRVYSTSY